jgi:hypothetical protein
MAVTLNVTPLEGSAHCPLRTSGAWIVKGSTANRLSGSTVLVTLPPYSAPA